MLKSPSRCEKPICIARSIRSGKASPPTRSLRTGFSPYSKLAPFGDYAEAAYSDGIALIELEINKPTTVSVMPVWDSTFAMAWSGDFLLLPGDSLELQRVADTRIPGLSSVRPRLAEVGPAG